MRRAELLVLDLLPRSSASMETRRWYVFLLIAAIFVLGGCKTIPEGRSAVNDVAIRGTSGVDDGDVEDKIATSPSPKFLGLFRGILYEYSVFDRFVLQRDLARVEAFYRSKGYWDAHARAGRVRKVDEKHVEVEIVVEEGQPVVVGKTHFEGLDKLPPEVAQAAQRGADSALPGGAHFEQDKYETATGNVRRALWDSGFAYAKVDTDAAVDIVRHQVDLVFTIDPGPKCTFGDVKIEGLGSLPEKPVRRAIDIDPGDAYSQHALDSAQQAVLDLGVFASVTVDPDKPEPPRPDHVVPVKVTVEPTRLRTVRLGGGIELDALKSDVHAVVGWEDRNFLGGLRTFSVNIRPGVVLHPIRINNLTTPERLLPEEKTRIELRQPGCFEARANCFIRPELDVYPVLLNPNPPPNAPVLGYAEAHGAIGIDRSIWKLYGALSHNVQYDYPFSYHLAKDPTLDTLLISYPELYTYLDFRNDKIHPRRGIWIGNTLQVAGGPFGGDARDVKVQPDVRGYIPITKRIVVAARGSVGWLWAGNYGGVVQQADFGGTAADRTHDYQLTFFRGFFSGGPDSNRGYPLRGVSPHAVVPFLNPEVAEQNLNQGCGEQCRTPTGGFTLWEASTEVRFDVAGPFSVATFCDASDVSPRENDIRLKHLHLSCGPGARYDTPVGPIRLDIGIRIPKTQVLGGLTPDEQAPPDLLGIPVAVQIGIGEAY
jgi:outer membrane protein insertion porin family/translocation and assembly module TamA